MKKVAAALPSKLAARRPQNAPPDFSESVNTTKTEAVAVRSAADEVKTRRREIKHLIDRASLEGLMSTPEHDALRKLAELWDEHLTNLGVPAHLLSRLYLIASDMRAKNERSGPFTIEDLKRAWPSLQKQITDEQSQNTRDAAGCTRCSGTGVEFVKVEGYNTARRCNHQPLLSSSEGVDE